MTYQVGQIVRIATAIHPSVAKIARLDDGITAQLGGYSVEEDKLVYGGFAFSYAQRDIAPATESDIASALWWAKREVSWSRRPIEPLSMQVPEDFELHDEDGVLIDSTKGDS